jgi:hypothetical protein
MTNEKKIWLCEQYAHKTWTVSLNFAQEAANSGYFGKGYAVVAEEARKLADTLFDYAAKARFEGNDKDFKGIMDHAAVTGLLAANASIEILNVEKNNNSRIESMLVLSEDLRNISLGLRDLNAGMKDVTSPSYLSPFVMPEITSPIRSSYKTDWFFRFSVNGVTMAENTANMQELCYVRKESVSGDTLSLRSYKLPIIDCGQKLKEWQTVMLVSPEGNRWDCKDGRYAMPIDDLDDNVIFTSRIGCNVPPKADHPFAEYARECWDVIGGDQLVFLDWRKLTGQKA